MSKPHDPESLFYVRPNDDWVCSSCNDSACGGCGEHGEQAETCIPRPSLRLQRGMLTLALTVLVAGLLVTLLSSPERNEWLAPGPLSRAHAQILADEGSRRCSACHGAGERTLVDWIEDAVRAGTHIPVSQSSLCMDCHARSLMQPFALFPHNLDPAALATLTASAPAGARLIGLSIPANSEGKLACATCHREHHGIEFDLSALTDRQCQTCHANYVHRFETDHPDFSAWPFHRPARIAFDHVAHGLKHFPEKNESFDCRSCHVEDSAGNVQKVAPFPNSCARCHGGEVSGPDSPQWTLLQLPMLDTGALAAAGKPVGRWPAPCDGDFDGALPPVMRLLLSSDPKIAAILQRRGPQFAWGDIDADNRQDLEDASQLAWAIKALIYELAHSTSRALQTRLRAAIGEYADDTHTGEDWGELAAGLHPDMLLQAQQLWLPDLAQELSARGEDAAPEYRPRRPWYGRLKQESREHDDLLVENPLIRLMESKSAASSLPGTTAEGRPLSDLAKPRVKIAGPDDPNDGTVTNSHARREPVAVAGNDEDLLARNPLVGQFPAGENDSPRLAVQPDPPPTTTATPDAIQVEPFHEELRSANSIEPTVHVAGWTRNDVSFAIRYQPVRHTDPVMASWIEWATQYAETAAVRESGLAESIMAPAAAGACMRCHSANPNSSASFATVSWSPEYRDPAIRDFTRFSHQPHTMISQLSDCQSCHRLNDPSTHVARQGIAGERGDFATLSKNECARCHREGGAPAGCSDCHNYHIGSRVSHHPR